MSAVSVLASCRAANRSITGARTITRPQSGNPNASAIAAAIQIFMATKVDLACERVDEKERSEEHTSELQSRFDLVCRLLLEKKKKTKKKKKNNINKKKIKN